MEDTGKLEDSLTGGTRCWLLFGKLFHGEFRQERKALKRLSIDIGVAPYPISEPYSDILAAFGRNG